MIIVMGGTNDVNRLVPVGEQGDETSDSVCGAVKNLMYGLKYNYPDARVVFCTMIKEKNEIASAEKIADCIVEPGKILTYL